MFPAGLVDVAHVGGVRNRVEGGVQEIKRIDLAEIWRPEILQPDVIGILRGLQ
jgi:hypothetical protein